MKKKLILLTLCLSIVTTTLSSNIITAKASTLNENTSISIDENIVKYPTMDEAFLENNGDLPDKFIITNNSNSTDFKARSMQPTVVYTLISERAIAYNAFLAWHPDFSKAEWDVLSYSFTASSKSALSISFGYGLVSIGVDAFGSQGSYYTKDGIRNEWSRPAIYGDQWVKTYRADYYSPSNGQLYQSLREDRPTIKNQKILILKRSGPYN